MVHKHKKVNKTPAPDGSHPCVLKELSSVIAKPMIQIHRDLLMTGVVPLDWCKAIAMPTFKKGKYLPSNYRLASLTSIVEKILGSLIIDHTVHKMFCWKTTF